MPWRVKYAPGVIMRPQPYKISYTFNQPYHGWVVTPSLDLSQPTRCIISSLDKLEKEVYRDRDYTLANEMINGKRKSRTD